MMMGGGGGSGSSGRGRCIVGLVLGGGGGEFAKLFIMSLTLRGASSGGGAKLSRIGIHMGDVNLSSGGSVVAPRLEVDSSAAMCSRSDRATLKRIMSVASRVRLFKGVSCASGE